MAPAKPCSSSYHTDFLSHPYLMGAFNWKSVRDKPLSRGVQPLIALYPDRHAVSRFRWDDQGVGVGLSTSI